MTNPVIGQFIASQVRNDVLTKLQARPRVRQALIEYYNFKIARPVIASQGGLLDHNDEVVFPIGTEFSTANWDALVEYLVSQRAHWSKTPVANVIRMAGANSGFKKTFNEAFVQDILGFGTRLSWDRAGSEYYQDTDPFEMHLVTRTHGSPLAYGTMLIERVVAWTGITGDPDDTPPLLETTRETGGELELGEFRNTFFNNGTQPPFIEGSEAIERTWPAGHWDFDFTNLHVKYRLVYYLPSEGVPGGGVNLGDAPLLVRDEHNLGIENYTSQLTSRMRVVDADRFSTGFGTVNVQDTIKDEVLTPFQYENDGGPVDANVQYGVAPTGQELIRVKVADFDDSTTWTGLTGRYNGLGTRLPLPNTLPGLRDLLNGPEFNEEAISTTVSRAARKVEAQNIASDSTYKKFFRFDQKLYYSGSHRCDYREGPSSPDGQLSPCVCRGQTQQWWPRHG